MLAVLHKRVLGLGHAGFAQLFPFDDIIPHGRHNKQLTFPHDHVVYFQQCLWHRSLFALIDVYNRLPQRIVDLKSVKDFQHELTDILRRSCNSLSDEWMHIFDPRVPSSTLFA